PLQQREDIEQRAQRQAASMERCYPSLKRSSSLDEWDDAVIDQLVTEFAELPCPALGDDGSCRIYETRPVTCRTMGIPSAENSVVHGACEVQTFVPIKRLSQSIIEQEQHLAHQEAHALEQLRR